MEGVTDPICNQLYLNVFKTFETSLETHHGPTLVAEFTLFLPHIYNVSTELIENLFCRQLQNFKNVDELLAFKFQNGTSASKSSPKPTAAAAVSSSASASSSTASTPTTPTASNSPSLVMMRHMQKLPITSNKAAAVSHMSSKDEENSQMKLNIDEKTSPSPVNSEHHHHIHHHHHQHHDSISSVSSVSSSNNADLNKPDSVDSN